MTKKQLIKKYGEKYKYIITEALQFYKTRKWKNVLTKEKYIDAIIKKIKL